MRRTLESGQQMVDAVSAAQYDSDQFQLYDCLTYRQEYHLSWLDKNEAYVVEGGNIGLRHCVTCLARKSHCLSRCLVWLNRHLKAFAHACSQR